MVWSTRFPTICGYISPGSLHELVVDPIDREYEIVGNAIVATSTSSLRRICMAPVTPCEDVRRVIRQVVSYCTSCGYAGSQRPPFPVTAQFRAGFELLNRRRPLGFRLAFAMRTSLPYPPVKNMDEFMYERTGNEFLRLLSIGYLQRQPSNAF